MQAWLASAVFLVALGLIATEWIHRTIVVVAGASLFLLFGVLDQHQAFDALDPNTIGLLIGMMVIVAVTQGTGIFEQLALTAMRLSRGKPALVVFSLTGITAVLSAFLDNLTAMLLVAPITIIVAGKFRMPPVPLLIVQIIASNIGGTATLIGDPPNIMIAGATGLSFNAFLVNLAPVSIVTLVVVVGSMYIVARTRFTPAGPMPLLEDIQPDVQLAKGWELWLPVTVLLATITAFFFHSALGLEPATIALLGATVLLLTRLSEVDEVLLKVDWPTLFFFAALFVMVGGLEAAGVLDAVARQTGHLTDDSRSAEIIGIMGFSALGSAFVDNIPFTAAMIPVVERLNETNDAGIGGRSPSEPASVGMPQSSPRPPTSLVRASPNGTASGSRFARTLRGASPPHCYRWSSRSATSGCSSFEVGGGTRSLGTESLPCVRLDLAWTWLR